jgi:dTDP-glucose pyrophosphorylase/CBS domain-containing protein
MSGIGRSTVNTEIQILCVGQTASVEEAVAQMDVSRTGIVLVVNQERNLLGTITDGDVRRAVLAHIDLSQPVSVLLERKEGSVYAQPISAPQSAERSTFLSLMQQHAVRHLPIVDEAQRVVGLVTLDEFVPDEGPLLQAVIMAGGHGSRLRPLTDHTPKPMLPLGGRPLLEITLHQLRSAGIKRVNMTVHHQSEQIIDHFGNGKEFGVEIDYVTEERPLGTAGSLGLMEVPEETVLVINGDVLTQVDYRAMVKYHRRHQADLTLAVQRYNMQVPYGVIECEGAYVQRLAEKPVSNYLVNAGIYLLEPSVYQYIPSGESFDMTELIQRVLDENRPVAAFPIHEYWLDIGQVADYQRAQEDLKGQKVQPLE